ncbi:hypothetical protein DPMN_167864 [Dreissena polymorpha]|uniref:Uncharacterized protein n=1 Tax=Dreissena polymorpha TaxID=45954 RepID=A0A9D4IZ47_DREPO|nr:hypothetical protein DPMN_167864 [Dreissena polymorpha]
MTAKLKSLPQTVPLLLQEVMSRIETDIGRELVATSLSLLVIARDGKKASFKGTCCTVGSGATLSALM